MIEVETSYNGEHPEIHSSVAERKKNDARIIETAGRWALSVTTADSDQLDASMVRDLTGGLDRQKG